MLNISKYEGDALEFYKAVLKSKTTEGLKGRLEPFEDFVAERFNLYNEHFNQERLYELDVTDFQDGLDSDLKLLYTYKLLKIAKLRRYLMTFEGIVVNTCQYCGVDLVSTMDHFLPQSEFPEFSVHPLNILPCCSTCNTKKNNNWRENNQLMFLNLLVDELPQIKYLTCSVDFDEDNLPLTTFELFKPDEITQVFFDRLTSHYKELDLFNRFSLASGKIIKKFRRDYRTHLKKNKSLQDFQETVAERNEGVKEDFGFNFWEVVLEDELAANEEFLTWCED